MGDSERQFDSWYDLHTASDDEVKDTLDSGFLNYAFDRWDGDETVISGMTDADKLEASLIRWSDDLTDEQRHGYGLSPLVKMKIRRKIKEQGLDTNRLSEMVRKLVRIRFLEQFSTSTLEKGGEVLFVTTNVGMRQLSGRLDSEALERGRSAGLTRFMPGLIGLIVPEVKWEVRGGSRRFPSVDVISMWDKNTRVTVDSDPMKGNRPDFAILAAEHKNRNGDKFFWVSPMFAQMKIALEGSTR